MGIISKKEHRSIFELLKEKKKGLLLDAACGDGVLGSAFNDIGYTVFFMDRYERPSHKQKFLKADLNALLPFKEASFDAIVCSESLQYIENHNQIFSEFYRLLKKSGSLVISLPNILSLSSRLFFLRRGYFPQLKPYKAGRSYDQWNFLAYNPISFAEVFQLMRKYGFGIITVSASGIKWKGLWLYPLLKALYVLGSVFAKDKKTERSELLKKLSSHELLAGDHIIVCGIK